MDFNTWYILLCVIAVVSLVAFIVQFRRTANPSTTYQKYLRLLAIPFVVECIYRSIFPSLYLQRFVVWDTIFNSILLDRTLAFFGEVAWTAQFSFVIIHLDSQLSSKKWVQICAYLAVIIYIVAEGMAFYNTATTNELWAANEVITEGFAFFFFFPATISLLIRQKGYAWRYAKIYTAVLCLTALIYPLYNLLVDSKMYMKRYRQDQANNKTYMKFLPGLEDAAVRRVKTHQTTDWSTDMSWMVCYFSVACWSSIMMMSPPEIVKPNDSEGKKSGTPLLSKNGSINQV